MKEELLVNQMLAEELDDLGKGERVLLANALAEQLDGEGDGGSQCPAARPPCSLSRLQGPSPSALAHWLDLDQFSWSR